MTSRGKRYRAVFLSDLHLGSDGCRASLVLEFLDSMECEELYLVGDVVDGWVGRRAHRWKHEHTSVLIRLLELSVRGTKVTYTPGNHDSFMRVAVGRSFGRLTVAHSAMHELLDGRRLLVTHGDHHDKAVTTYKPVAWMCAWVYELLLRACGLLNRRRERKGRGPLLPHAIKNRVKGAVGRNSGLDELVKNEALTGGCIGVVFGHNHRPEFREDEDGFLHINTGDWVEHATVFVEHLDGQMELVDWLSLKRQAHAEPPSWFSKAHPDESGKQR